MNIVYLAIYFLIIFVATLFVKSVNSKDYFLLGNRNVNATPMAFSIASTWVWAPALFVSAEQAYTNGWVGLFWFTVPNVLCLLLFIPFAKSLRDRMPRGYTLSEYMGDKYSKRVKGVYLFQLSSLSLLSTVVQLLAGGKVITLMTGIPFWLTTLILGLFAFSYSFRSGLRASVMTDSLQLIFILCSLFIVVSWVLGITGFESLSNGALGAKESRLGFLDSNGMHVMLSFGIPTTIALLSGPFGDQNFWQRALSVKKEKLTLAFVLSAVLFACVPILMGSLGFIARGIGITDADSSIINLVLVEDLLPAWTSIFFIFIILSGLLSTINSNLSSMSSLANDIIRNANLKKLRLSMLVLTIVSVALSNIPVSIIDFFLFYGILRATTFATTTLTLSGVTLRERGVFYGVIGSLVVGFPTFIYGSVAGNTALKLTGSVLALALSGIIAILMTKVGAKFDTKKENVH